jgi:hypothetical protein
VPVPATGLMSSTRPGQWFGAQQAGQLLGQLGGG